MTRWIILIVVVVVLTAAATFITQSAPNSEAGPTPLAVNESNGPTPKVEIVAPLLHDFGSMSQFRKDSHTWEVKNAGDADLEMWMESSTCSCTIAKLATEPGVGKEKPKVRVKPHAATPIQLEWDTKSFGPEYQKSATIGTNDPSRPMFTLIVKGKVYPPVLVYPPEMITLNGISNEEVTRTTVAVFSMDMPTMKITKIRTSRPALIETVQTPLTKVDHQHLKLSAGGYRVDLLIKPGMSLGRFTDELVIETDHPLQKEVKVSISGYATGPISVVPERIRMTGVSSSLGATHSLTLLVRGGRPTSFEIVQKPEKINVTIEPDKAQKGRYRLTVAVPPGTPPTVIDNETIIIKTDHPKASEVKIPVSIWISNSTPA